MRSRRAASEKLEASTTLAKINRAFKSDISFPIFEKEIHKIASNLKNEKVIK